MTLLNAFFCRKYEDYCNFGFYFVARYHCLVPFRLIRAVLNLGRWKVNAEISSNSVPPYLSKQSELTVQYQKEWLGSIV